MERLKDMSDKRLVNMLALLTVFPNGDVDCVRLAVRIRAELGARAAAEYIATHGKDSSNV